MKFVNDPNLIKELDAEYEKNQKGSSLNEINDPNLINELNKQLEIDKKQNINQPNNLKDFVRKLVMGSSPFEQLRAGIVGASRGGENIAKTLTGGYAPEGTQYLSNLLNYKGASPSEKIAETTGQYLPLLVANPSGLLKQILAGAGYQGLQTPENPALGAIEGAVIPPVISGIGKLGRLAISPFKSLKPLQELAEQAGVEHQAVSEEEKNLLENVKAQLGKKDIGGLRYSRGQAEKELSEIPVIQQQPTIQQAQTNLENTEKNIGQLLNKDAVHDVEAANRYNQIINSRKSTAKTLYDSVEQDMADKNIVVDNTEEIKKLNKKLYELSQEGKTFDKEGKEVALKIADLQTGNDIIPARDYLSTYRTVRDYANDAYKNAYKVGITDEERMAAFKRAEELQEKSEEMKKLLHEGLGEESSKLLTKADDFYSKAIAPLQRNKVYLRLRYQGTMPENIMKSIRGTAEGMQELREIAQKDPELLRHVVGQRFAKNPSKLHEIGDLEKEYIDNFPELKKLISSHKEQSENLLKAKQFSRKSQLEEKIRSIDEEIKNIREVKARKNISLQKKMDAEKKLEKLKNEKSKVMKLLKIGAVGYFGYKIGGKAVSGLEQLFSE